MFGFLNSQNIINITIDQNSICCAFFERKNRLFNLKAYQRYLIEAFEIYNLNIFNPIKFNKLLRSFIISNKIKDPVFNLAFSGRQVMDKIITFDSMPKTVDEFDLQTQKIFWNIYQLNDDKKFVFYVTGIEHSLIFQYKIFGYNFDINFLKIKTTDCVLMKLINPYCQVNQIEYKIDQLNIEDYVYTDLDIDLVNEKQFIFKSLGLFLL